MDIRNRPLHQRKMIAMAITGGVTIVLLIVLVMVYQQKGSTDTTAAGQLTQFYTTITARAQSLFETK